MQDFNKYHLLHILDLHKFPTKFFNRFLKVSRFSEDLTCYGKLLKILGPNTFRLLYSKVFWFHLEMPKFNLCSESVGALDFKILVEDSDTGGPGSVTVRMEYLFAFQFWYCELCVENRWGGRRKHYLVNFCSLVVLLLSVGEGWWGRAESLI